ncbi:hypothetical protein M9H77_07908 [Catharanthus roseus]|uniref:Uncharacterized protein n=1 Tax=Catharanthus roseus TaxID=4058 RepID=A0ACC0BW99_CATRO|nr:hypothetical protein M9H77_07908 [Catharanthus roseus]
MSEEETFYRRLTGLLLARAKHNFHHGGGNVFNAYGRNNHGNVNFTPRKQVGVDNFSSYANSFEHTSNDNYGDTLKPSLIEELSKLNELPQATIEVDESVVLHVKEEISNVEHCDLMRDKNNEKGEYIEIKENGVEEKEKLVERLCIFDSISVISKESELLECSTEKESEFEKSERIQARMKEESSPTSPSRP